jgi:hypothetical protein
MAATIYVWDGYDDQRMLRVDIKFMNEGNNISTSLYLQHQKNVSQLYYVLELLKQLLFLDNWPIKFLYLERE